MGSQGARNGNSLASVCPGGSLSLGDRFSGASVELGSFLKWLQSFSSNLAMNKSLEKYSDARSFGSVEIKV